MPPRFHIAHAFVAFDGIVRQVEKWIEGASLSAGGYSARDVSERLAQRVVELGLFPFSRQCMQTGDASFATGSSVANLDGLLINVRSGKVHPSLRLLLGSLAEFAFHWLHILGNLIAGLLRTSGSDARPATLVLGVGAESLFVDRNDARFVEFCERGPITPLATARRLIVQAPSARDSSKPELVEYSKYPLLALVRNTPMRPGVRASCLLEHLAAIGTFWSAIRRLPAIATLARDFAYAPLLTHLNRHAAIDAIVISNSVYSRQELWMRGLPGKNFAVHMIWYSQNTIPFVYAQDGLVSDVPNYRHLKVDVSWVWTPGFARYLERIGIKTQVNVVGPILWCLPRISNSHPHRESINIAVFDVTPIKPDFERRLGLVYNYYSGSVITQFLDDVTFAARRLEIATGRKVRMTLKQKRQVNLDLHIPIHDLPTEKDSSVAFDLIPPNANIFEILSESDVAIVLPYSSPAYVAACMGVPAIFHDATRALLPTHEAHPMLQFSSGRDQLVVALEKILVPAEPA